MKPTRRGLTGIETAIILIAIVLVAAAFAFVVMNMGFGVTQKTGEAITKGAEEASSSLEVAGTVLAVDTDTGDYIVIYVKPGVGGVPVDVNTTVITFIVEEPSNLAAHYVGRVVYAGSCGGDPVAACANQTVCACEVYGDGDNLIEPGERFAFVVKVDNITTVTGQTLSFVPYMKFTVEIKPPQGAILKVTRRLPASLSPVMETW